MHSELRTSTLNLRCCRGVVKLQHTKLAITDFCVELKDFQMYTTSGYYNGLREWNAVR